MKCYKCGCTKDIYPLADSQRYLCADCYRVSNYLTWFMDSKRKKFIVDKKNQDKYCVSCKGCGTNFQPVANSIGYCYRCHLPDGMREWSYTPELIFYKEENETTDMYIGVELEVDGYDNKRIDVVDSLSDTEDDFLYFKKDGSVTYGVEIVSHPATYNYHCNHHWKNIFDVLKENKMDILDNCGLHFHIDRRCFNAHGIASLDCFVYHNVKFIEKQGGRTLNNYCRAEFKNLENWGRGADSHYRAVELTHDNTVELRFCKSTNDYDVFMSRLKFIKQLVDFSNAHTIQDIITKDTETLWKNYFGE